MQELMARIEKYARLDEDVPTPTLAKVGTSVTSMDTKKPRKEENGTKGKKSN